MGKIICFISLIFTAGCEYDSTEIKYFNGHTYVVFDCFNGFKHGRGFSIVHDPDCKCQKK
jgi:hypothetical protein